MEDPERRLVARGNVHKLGSTVHYQQIADDQVRVSVEEVIIVDVPLPLPTDDLKIVSDVKGTFISWPKKLVDVSNPYEEILIKTPLEAPAPKVVEKPKLDAKEQIILMAFDPKFEVKSWLVNEVLGLPDRMPVFINRDDIHSLIGPK